MAGLTTKDRALASMRALLGCMCTALGDYGWRGDCCLEPGEVAWDQCGPEPKAWVRLVDVYPSRPYPLFASNVKVEDVQWALTLEMGAVTQVCDDDCDCAVKTSNTEAVVLLAAAMLDALACCGLDSCGDDPRAQPVQVTGPEGLCAGAKMAVNVPIDPCCA